MDGIHLTIVTPSGKPFDGNAESLTAPGELGSFGVLQNHAPMIVGLKPGILTVTEEAKTSFFVVGQGVLEVSHGSQVVVLVDAAKAADGKAEAEALLAARGTN